jgi:RNA polymerase sigma-70 factor, ECF subfamily
MRGPPAIKGSLADGHRVPSQDAITAEALYRAHARFVAAFARRLGIPEAELEDVVQEVFIIAHRKGGYAPGKATPRSWLGAITLRVASQARRTRRRRREASQADALASLQSPAGSPHHVTEARDSLARVQAALERLDMSHRAVFVMFEIEGERCEDIARALNVPVGTVYSRLHKARARFRSAYEASGDSPGRMAPSPAPGPIVEET